MLVCGLLKILLTIFKIMALGIGFTGKTVEYVAKMLAAGADRCSGALGEAEDKQLSEVDDDEEKPDEEDSGDEKEEKEDSGDSAGGEDSENSGEEDSKEEDVVEPDEKLSPDATGEEPSDEEAGAGELSD